MFLLTQMNEYWEKEIIVFELDLPSEIKLKWPWCLKLSPKIFKRHC